MEDKYKERYADVSKTEHITTKDVLNTTGYIDGDKAGYAINPKNDEEHEKLAIALGLATSTIKTALDYCYDYEKAVCDRHNPHATDLYATECDYAWSVALKHHYKTMPDEAYCYCIGFLSGYRKQVHERKMQECREGVARLKEIVAQLSSDR